MEEVSTPLIMVLESVHGNNNSEQSTRKHKQRHKRGGSGPAVGGKHKYSLSDLDEFLHVESTPSKSDKNEITKRIEPTTTNLHNISMEDDEKMEEVVEVEEPVQNITDDEDVEMILDTVDNSFQPDFTENHNVTYGGTNVNVQADKIPRVTTLFVVDTNFIISHLDILEELRALFSIYHHAIMIPRYTIRELDGLKNGNTVSEKKNLALKTTRDVGEAARKGNTWIYSHLANMNSGVIGQKLTQRMDINVVKDDAILDCCIYFKERKNCFVILLSNDKNLCLKALTDDILTVSYRDGMTGELIAKTAFEENAFRYGSMNAPQVGMTVPVIATSQNNGDERDKKYTFDEASDGIFQEIVTAVLESIDYIMRDEYGDTIEFLDFDLTTLKSLTDVSRCVHKYWLSVFSEYFRGERLQKDSWKLLPVQLTTKPKDISTLTIFQQFWSDILEHFFIKRNPEEQDKLQYCIQQWENGIKNVI